MEDNLDKWAAFAGAGKEDARICRVPPALHTLPVRPIVLDTALNYVEAPSLEHRLPKKQQGQQGSSMVSRLFGWR